MRILTWHRQTAFSYRKGGSLRYKRTIKPLTLEKHQRIIAAEVSPERKTLYQLCWHLGASQGDIANLKGEEVDRRAP
jgi:integrase